MDGALGVRSMCMKTDFEVAIPHLLGSCCRRDAEADDEYRGRNV